MTSGIPFFHVDAFAESAFSGNPAAVCLLHQPRPADWMQAVAAEMNLAETAFVRPLGEDFELRWFTPSVEVDLCGHATLASAHVLWEARIVQSTDAIRFHSKSGLLNCSNNQGKIELDFPATPVMPHPAANKLVAALNVRPVFEGRSKFDSFLVLDSEHAVRAVQPDFRALQELSEIRGVIVTSLSRDPAFDFVSRFFAPAAGIDEDPVTGSAHCALACYWSAELGKDSMVGFQASSRGGIVSVRKTDDRVVLGGTAVTVVRGHLLV